MNQRPQYTKLSNNIHFHPLSVHGNAVYILPVYISRRVQRVWCLVWWPGDSVHDGLLSVLRELCDHPCHSVCVCVCVYSNVTRQTQWGVVTTPPAHTTHSLTHHQPNIDNTHYATYTALPLILALWLQYQPFADFSVVGYVRVPERPVLPHVTFVIAFSDQFVKSTINTLFFAFLESIIYVQWDFTFLLHLL